MPPVVRVWRSRTPITVGLAGVLVVLLVITAVLFNRISSLQGQLRSIKTNAAAASASVKHQFAASQAALNGLANRVGDVEAKQKSQPDLATVAKTVKASVFVVSTDTDLGSAWVVSSSQNSSTLVTNYHVVESTWANGGHGIQVKQGDATYPGTITQVDINDDLALVTTPERFPALTRANQAPQVGDSVLVVGAPLGLDQTVANGIVSATRTENGHDYLQFSAPISPGDSGGPVVNQAGDVVGITVAKIVDNNAEGLSLAIPISVLCSGLNACS